MGMWVGGKETCGIEKRVGRSVVGKLVVVWEGADCEGLRGRFQRIWPLFTILERCEVGVLAGEEEWKAGKRVEALGYRIDNWALRTAR